MGARNRVERRRPQTTTIDGHNVNMASTGARLTAASESFGTTGREKIPASVWWLPKLQYVRQALELNGWGLPVREHQADLDRCCQTCLGITAAASYFSSRVFCLV
jgi:hypothetical protein